MDENAAPTPAKRGVPKKSVIVIVILLLVIVGLGVVLWWCWFKKDHHAPAESVKTPTTTTTVATGPCKDGAENVLPAGYTFYESTAYGFKFAYPTAWGTVNVATTPMGGSAGHYLHGTFSGNDGVWFGGNGTDYVVNARGGMPTDNPGYLVATDKYYSVQIMKYSDGGTVEDRYDLFPIEGTPVLKQSCNTSALLSSYPYTEFYDYAYELARINLQPNNLYYGVNFVLKNPNATSKADFDKIISSFQLIP